MSAPDVTVRLQALGGQWETCGADRAIGVRPDTLSLTSNSWGPDKASFNLVRQPIATWPDLGAYAPAEVEIGGVVVWKGRVLETPLKDGAERQVNVQCEGMQYHLDDDVYERAYVHAKLTDWRDVRSFPTAPLAQAITAGSVQTAQGSIVIGFGNGAVVPAGAAVAAVLDMGPYSLAKRVVLKFTNAGVAAASGLSLYAKVMADPSELVSAGENIIGPLDPATAASPKAGTAATPRRYLAIILYNEGGTVTLAADRMVKITGISVFAATAYETGNASILKASTVIPDALERATLLLSADHSLIQATTFNIPDFTLTKLSSPREAIEAANAYHNWVTKLDVLDRMIFAPRPSSPVVEIGAWAGSETEDASANSGAEIYSRAIVEGAGGDGTQLAVEHTRGNSEPEGLVERRGFQRTKVIQVNSAITTAEAEQIGKVFLEGHLTTPFKGSAKVTPGGVRTVLGGAAIHPSQLLLHTAELLRLAHIADPDTGGIGRDGTIAGVTYTHKDQAAQVELDEQRGNFDALLSRLQVVQTPGS